MLIVAALTAVGVALRLAVAQQSLFADELSTRYVLAGHGLADVMSVVHTDAEITPPLYFVASWLTTRVDFSPLMLRTPSLIAGAAAIPLVYLLAVRTVGRRAGLVAAGLTTFSPFMIFYSTEARGYEVMVALVLGSTLCLLAAAESGRARWWTAYAVCTCAAVYTHYTAVFALAGQFLWLLWAHPESRFRGFLATTAAAVGFLPWISGLRGDLNSPTTDILSALQPFNLGYVRSSIAHWAIGFPYAMPRSHVTDLPGVPALAALAVALLLGIAGLLRSGLRWPDRRVMLVIVLAASVPVGEAIASAIGSNLLGTRNLAASWPAFAICLAALLVAAGPRAGVVASVLAVAAFAAGGLRLLDRGFRRPDYTAAIAFVDRAAGPGDVVIDGVSLSPGGVPTTIDVAFTGRHPVFALGRTPVAYDPFRILGPAPATADVVHKAADTARDRHLFMVVAPDQALTREAIAALPAGYRQIAARTYLGTTPIAVLEFAQTASGA